MKIEKTASRGPVPKRNEERSPANKRQRDLAEYESAEVLEIPKPSLDDLLPGEEIHPIARNWFEYLSISGQVRFYEWSDWMQAALISKIISDEFKLKPIGVDRFGNAVYAIAPMSGATLGQVLKASSSLMVTEGDRRRMGIQLMRNKADQEERERHLALVSTEAEAAFGA